MSFCVLLGRVALVGDVEGKAHVVFPKSSLIVVDVLAGVSKNLIQELETRFPTHGIMDAFGIRYPQY
jgi:hypothetical protein